MKDGPSLKRNPGRSALWRNAAFGESWERRPWPCVPGRGLWALDGLLSPTTRRLAA